MRIEAAQKVRVKELLAGEFEEVSIEGTRYFRLPWGSVSRVRIMGLVLDSTMKEDGSFATLELHDGTASIQVRAWDEDVNSLIDPDTGRIYGTGSIIDLIGRVKSWKDTIYLSPVLVMKVRDPNAILLRELEILRRELRLRGKPKLRNLKEDIKVIIRALKELGPLSAEEVADLLKGEVDDVRMLLDEMVTSGLLYESRGKYGYVGQR